jgi:hypothetical protein
MLVVMSSPAMATVLVDGDEAGRTPLKLPIIVGNHRITVRKEGFADAVHSVTIEEGQTKEVNSSLTANYEYSSPDNSTAYYLPKTSTSSSSFSASSKQSSTSLKNSKTTKSRSDYRAHQRGFESMIDVSTEILSAFYASNLTNPTIEFTYTAGYRFNNIIYLGAGAGFCFIPKNLEDIERFNLDRKDYFHSRRSGSYLYYDEWELFDNDILSPCGVCVPFFAYMRTNFINRRFSPFFALAVGGKFSARQTLELDECDVKYPTSTFFATPQLGFNIRTSLKTSICIGAGVPLLLVPAEFGHTVSHAIIKYVFDLGVDLRVGVSF